MSVAQAFLKKEKVLIWPYEKYLIVEVDLWSFLNKLLENRFTLVREYLFSKIMTCITNTNVHAFINFMS